ncbi:MAG: hypothetical protein NC184_05305 [Roseburia sp.]|nr:hypothetical protein [Roseburia sp.]
MRRRIIYISVTVVVSLVLILLGIFVFTNSYLRLFESFKDFGTSIAFYFTQLFGIQSDINPTVTNYSGIIPDNPEIPSTPTEAGISARAYFDVFFSADNFRNWGLSTAHFITMALLIILPCILLLILLIRFMYGRCNTHHNKDTIPLKAFKLASRVIYQPTYNAISGYFRFLRRHRWIIRIWLAVIALHLNLVTILIEFFAFYFYFAISIDVSTIFSQIRKLFMDLTTFLTVFNVWGIIILILWLFNRWRRKIALARLRHYEARNCGFINALPIVSITCGSMGKKKTTMITDMTLSQEVMFRQRALEILQKSDLKFPYFPWICFEQELLHCMAYGVVYNLATVKKWVQLKRQRFNNHGNVQWQLYGYNICKYGNGYDNGLYISELFDVLETYALSYFIYVISSSLIVSNYSIRTSNVKSDLGNLPLWLMDFFVQRDIKNSRHSHILDFDILRLGKKVIENNIRAGSFEFGVVTISEIGKERGNNLELREVKRSTDETNQKNDLFNSWLKMCRHSATVDNFPFIKVFTDEQRPESWGADARDLCDIIQIVDSSEIGITLPFYTLQDMLSEWLFNKFIATYTDFRYRRGDNTLFIYLYKKLVAWVWNRNVRNYNRYGYCVLNVETERGTMDGKADKKKYYLMNAKIYGKRFSTDCFSDYFNDLASRTNVGLDDYLEYQTEKASVEELKSQNSYFINSLYGR